MTKSLPTQFLGSFHRIFPALPSEFWRSVAEPIRRPASSTTTEIPRLANSLAIRLPQAPAPTTTTSATGEVTGWNEGIAKQLSSAPPKAPDLTHLMRHRRRT